MDQDQRAQRATVEIGGELDRHAVEALQLEIRRLAKQHGIDVEASRVEKVEPPPDASA